MRSYEFATWLQRLRAFFFSVWKVRLVRARYVYGRRAAMKKKVVYISFTRAHARAPRHVVPSSAHKEDFGECFHARREGVWGEVDGETRVFGADTCCCGMSRALTFSSSRARVALRKQSILLTVGDGRAWSLSRVCLKNIS